MCGVFLFPVAAGSNLPQCVRFWGVKVVLIGFLNGYLNCLSLILSCYLKYVTMVSM